MNENENQAGDFVDSVNKAAEEIRKTSQRLPPLHPTPDELVDISKDEEPKKDGLPTLLKVGKFTARYGYFDVSKKEDREELETIMNHVLQDGWLQAREEMTILKDGSAIIVLKYLVPTEAPKRPPEAK